MAIIKLSLEEIAYLGEYPELIYEEGENVIRGILSFDLRYEDNETIKDKYQIEINLGLVSDEGIPIVKETANRIIGISINKGKKSEDLHLNSSSGEMCIIIPPKAKERYPNGFNLRELLFHLQEHLYWISYYEKYNKPPWKEFGHHDLGYLELYLENKEKYAEDCKKYFRCANRRLFKKKIIQLKKKYNL